MFTKRIERPEDTNDNIVYSYTRADALNDGLQRDITGIARECGFKITMFITDSFGDISGEELISILITLHHAILADKAGESMVKFQYEGDLVYAQIGPVDWNNSLPAITIMHHIDL